MKRIIYYSYNCAFLLLYFFTFSTKIYAQNSDEGKQTLFDKVQKRANEIADSLERDGHSQYLANSGSFNASEPRFQRFINSPCYGKIGLRIFDLENLEREYAACENEYYSKYYVLFSFIILVLITMIILAIFKKRNKKRKIIADKIQKLKDVFFIGDYSTKMIALEELRSTNILSEKEFLDKVLILYEAYTLEVNNKLKENTILQLEKAFKAGVLTQSEFNKKTEELKQ